MRFPTARTVLNLISYWNVTSVLLLAAYVNVLTGLPWDWFSDEWPFGRFLSLLGLHGLLFGGICFLLVYEEASREMQIAEGRIEQALRSMPSETERRLRRRVWLGGTISALGIAGAIAIKTLATSCP